MVKRFFLGRRLASEEAGHQRLRKTLALPVFASDPLSSNAYATEEMMLVLVLAGTGALALSLPIAVVIGAVLAIVVVSYRWIVRAYPHGGGAYVVSKDNLGELAGLIAGGAILVDYMLVVAVSASAGAFALATLAPGLLEHRVTLALVFVAFVTAMNLRGVRESGVLFAIPTYGFFISVMVMIGVGVARCATAGCPEAVAAGTEIVPSQELTLFLILRAFASGSTALTGVAAVTDGVGAFQGRRPADRAQNAATTLTLLAVMTISMYIGITYLATQTGVVVDPAHHERSVIGQVAEAVFDGGFGFALVQVMTALILILAANTAYADFPRLASFIAHDRYLPRQFVNLGDRLVFSNGVFALTLMAMGLIVWAQAEVTKLIQLYVIGVFAAFALSQAGMVKFWRRKRDSEPRWKRNAVINAVGAVATGIVLVIVTVTKFTHGAWIAIVAIVLLVLLFKVINRHYLSVGRQLRVAEERPSAITGTHAFIAVSVIDESVYEAVAYARAMRPRSLLAITVGEPSSALVGAWRETGLPIDLRLIEGSANDPSEALRGFLRSLDLVTDEVSTVILPELYEKRGMIEVLKRRKALRIKTALLFEPRVVVTDIPVLATGRAPERLHAPGRIISVVLVSAVHNASLRAIEYARSLSPTEVRAVTFNVDPDATARLLEAWGTSVEGVPLEAVDSPFRSVSGPLIGYVREIRRRNPDAVVSVVIPEFVVRRLWHQLLHNQTALQLKRALLYEEGVFVTSVPTHLD